MCAMVTAGFHSFSSCLDKYFSQNQYSKLLSSQTGRPSVKGVMGPDVRMGRRHAHWRWSGLINIETVAEIIGLTWQCADGRKGDLGQSLSCWNRSGEREV